MNSGYSTTPRIQRLKLFCLKVLNIVSHVDNFQRLSLPTSWTGLLPSVKRPPCQKVVIWKFLTIYRQSNNAVHYRISSATGATCAAGVSTPGVTNYSLKIVNTSHVTGINSYVTGNKNLTIFKMSLTITWLAMKRLSFTWLGLTNTIPWNSVTSLYEVR